MRQVGIILTGPGLPPLVAEPKEPPRTETVAKVEPAPSVAQPVLGDVEVGMFGGKLNQVRRDVQGGWSKLPVPRTNQSSKGPLLKLVVIVLGSSSRLILTPICKL